jgi:hypothetical protein
LTGLKPGHAPLKAYSVLSTGGPHMTYRNPLTACAAFEESTEDMSSDIMDNDGWEWVWIDDMISFTDDDYDLTNEYMIGTDDENLSDTFGDLGFLATYNMEGDD